MKLVLFDIDGTLIHHIGEQKGIGFIRFQHVIREVYGKEIDLEEVAKQNYGGWIDRGIVRHMLKDHGVSDREFIEKWPRISVALKAYAEAQAAGGKKLYQAFPEAIELAHKLAKREDVRVGLMTGNVERMGWWKIEHAGIVDVFSFGVFADDVDDRISLAKTVFEKAQKHFTIQFDPKDISVIGDTIHDIRCGKAIGATTIAVTTGQHASFVKNSTYREDLEREKPDFLVDSLLDPAVCDFFGV